jgi:hypothetical protein
MEGAASIVATATGAAPVLVTVQQVDATTATVYAWTVTGEPAPATTIVAVAFGAVAPVAVVPETEALD